MKALKGLVIFMGLLLVAGFGLLAYGMYSKAGQLGKSGGAARAADGAVFGQTEVPLPAGARVEQMVAAGERVVLRISGGGSERYLVLDPASGRVAGSFVLVPEVPAAR